MGSRSGILLKYLLALGGVLVISTCTVELDLPTQPPRENDIDPLNPNYTLPKTTIISAPSGTIGTTTVTIMWEGNNDQSEFSYRLNDNAYSPWTMETTAVLDYIDDGPYTFEVKSRYPTGVEEETPPQVEFIVDALPPGSLFLYPYGTRAEQGETIWMELRVEDVPGFKAISAVLDFDAAVVSPSGSQLGAFLSKDGGTVIALCEPSTPWELAIGLAGGPEGGVQGSGTIISLSFEVLTTTTISHITLMNVDVRGPNDEQVTLEQVRGAVVRRR
jgi:hypothetical protein